MFRSVPLKDLPGTPLAEQLRPQQYSEVIGQDAIVKTLSQWQAGGRPLPSMILYGPPGSGKTTLAQVLGRNSKARWRPLNATSSSVKELREVGEEGENVRRQFGERLLVFVDEIHRFSKSQQEVLLPMVEQGHIWLVGATTENPRISLTAALLSRLRVIALSRLSPAALKGILQRHVPNIQNYLNPKALDVLVAWADGDARKLLGALETLQPEFSELAIMTEEDVQERLGKFYLRSDLRGDIHYDLASALIKSLRGSDPDAALYYLARLIEGGEDPLFIARRLMIFASEDVGNAEPRALPLAVAGAQAVQMIGFPEAAINLSQVVTFLACCPKSNRSYVAIKQAQKFVQQTGSIAIPVHLANHHPDYKYPHDYERSWVHQSYFPPLPKDVEPPKFYEPSDRGQEKTLAQYLAWVRGESGRSSGSS